VIEVDRPDPDRAGRRRNGKSDPLDAESAARAVQSGRAAGTPKSRDAQVEMIRVLRVARRGAMKARIQAGAQLDALILTAPEPVRAPLRKLTSKQRIRACAVLRPSSVSDPVSAVKTALRTLARRWQVLQAEIDDLDLQLAWIPRGGRYRAGSLIRQLDASACWCSMRSKMSASVCCCQPGSWSQSAT
jgi:hypothetical protein